MFTSSFLWFDKYRRGKEYEIVTFTGFTGSFHFIYLKNNT